MKQLLKILKENRAVFVNMKTYDEIDEGRDPDIQLDYNHHGYSMIISKGKKGYNILTAKGIRLIKSQDENPRYHPNGIKLSEIMPYIEKFESLYNLDKDNIKIY